METTVVEASRRNVLIVTENHMGSGVVIADNTVLTCFHLLEVRSRVMVGTNRSNVKLAQVLHVAPEYDLAMLGVPTVQVVPIELNLRPRVFQVVYYIGNPHGHLSLVSPGYILKVEGDTVFTNTLAMRGASGGGLFDLEGQLLGINSGIEGQADVGYPLVRHISAKAVGKFLESYILKPNAQ